MFLGRMQHTNIPKPQPSPDTYSRGSAVLYFFLVLSLIDTSRTEAILHVMKGKTSGEQTSSTSITHVSTINLGGLTRTVFASAMQFFQIFGVLKLLLPLEES